MDIDEKCDVLKKLKFASQEKTELILAQEFSLQLDNEEKQKIHRDERIQIAEKSAGPSVSCRPTTFSPFKQVAPIIHRTFRCLVAFTIGIAMTNSLERFPIGNSAIAAEEFRMRFKVDL